MRALLQDLRYAVRMFAKKPAFTAVVVVTLALGIGANTAIFSVINGVLLRPLPYESPDELVTLRDVKGHGLGSATYPNVADWRQQNSVFEDIGVYRSTAHTLTGADTPERVKGARVSAAFLSVLGIEASLGRTFRNVEDLPGVENVAVLSDGCWRRRFGADAGLIGQTVTLDAEEFTVVGILPPGFDFPLEISATEVWTPAGLDEGLHSQRSWHCLGTAARLRAGVTMDQARTAMETIAARLEQQYPESNAGLGVRLESLHNRVVGRLRPVLLVLFGSVALVLLVACANVASLLLVRSADRRKELAVRAALGARPLRLIRQLLTESLLLGVAGGAMGLLLASWGFEGLLGFLPADLPRGGEIAIDGRVLIFTLVVSAVTGLVFGLVPALHTARFQLFPALKEGGSTPAGGERNRLRRAIVVSEMALTLALLVGAGLLMRTFWRLTDVDPGFDQDNLLTFQISVPSSQVDDPTRRSEFYRRLIERIGALPGVDSVAGGTTLPFSNRDIGLAFRILGRPEPPSGDEPKARYNSISPEYFRTLGISLLAGRPFTALDGPGRPGVMIINEAMAQRFWPGEDPIGQRVEPLIIIEEDGAVEPFEIVGVVGNVRNKSLDTAASPCMYVPSRHQTWASMYFAVRTTGDPLSLVSAIRSEAAAVTKEQAPHSFRRMDQCLVGSLARRKFSMLLLGVFAIAALVITAVGVYGVFSHTVAQRTHEIGVRMALGAQPEDVLRLVLRRGLALTGPGLCIGVLLALASTRMLSSMLYEISATDPTTFVGVCLLLGMVALLACYIPARRATKVDPMVALRCE